MDIDEATHFVLEKVLFPSGGGSGGGRGSGSGYTYNILRNVAVAIMTKTAAVRGQCCRAATTAAVKMDP